MHAASLYLLHLVEAAGQLLTSLCLGCAGEVYGRYVPQSVTNKDGQAQDVDIVLNEIFNDGDDVYVEYSNGPMPYRVRCVQWTSSLRHCNAAFHLSPATCTGAGAHSIKHSHAHNHTCVCAHSHTRAHNMPQVGGPAAHAALQMGGPGRDPTTPRPVA